MRINQNLRAYTAGERQFLLYNYLLSHSSKENVVKPSDISDFLLDNGIQVNINTIYNDLNTLKNIETFNLDIEYDFSKKGYRVNNPPLEPYEIRLIANSIQSSKFITQAKARDLLAKIKKLTDRYTAASLNNDAFVFERIHSQNDNPIEHIERIYQAIADDKQIRFKRFSYTPDKSKPKSYSKKGDFVVVSPYKLIWHNGNLYLLAYVGGKRNRFDYFRVDRLENISKPLLLKREGKEKYQKYEEKLKKVKIFDMVMGTEYNVKMRFKNSLASAVIDKFGKDIMMMPDENDCFTVRQPIDVNAAFFAWIATFGGGAKIVEPPEVVDRMRKFLENAAKMYKEDGEM